MNEQIGISILTTPKKLNTIKRELYQSTHASVNVGFCQYYIEFNHDICTFSSYNTHVLSKWHVVREKKRVLNV